MATPILGMAGTGSFTASERPTNFRDMILYLYPNSPAILTAISGRLKTEAVNDPKFTIFHKGLPAHRAMVASSMNNDNSSTDIALDTSGGANPEKIFRAGHVVMCERTQEVMWVTATDTAEITVATRGSVGTSAAALATGDYLLIIGNYNEEGASTPESISFNADTTYNYTQIFRTPMKLTGTMKETYLRTGDVSKELLREAAERHAIEQEWAWMWGQRHEATGTGGQYVRTTGGLLEFISTNVTDFSGSLTKSAWESFLEGVFLIPSSSSEKLCLCGNKALTALNAMAQAYGQIQLVPTSETYGMKIARYETPYGTLMLKGHPLLSQNPGFNDWGFVIDTKNIVYRPLKNRDTKLLKDRQSPGTDAVIHEYLTEAGLEIRHEQTHGIFKNCTSFVP